MSLPIYTPPSGKGSVRRPANAKRFRENYDGIDWHRPAKGFCRRCDGSGVVWRVPKDGPLDTVKCPDCEGAGRG